MQGTLISSLALLLISTLTPLSAHATERRFTHIDRTRTSPAVEVELENWLTWKFRPGAFLTLEMRHELEIGLTDNTQIGIRLANSDYDARARSSAYQHSAFERIHNQTNLITDFLGSALFSEIPADERNAEFEGEAAPRNAHRSMGAAETTRLSRSRRATNLPILKKVPASWGRLSARRN